LKAINKEMSAIIDLKVFETITPEEACGKRTFKSRFVFKVKIEPDSSIIFKARLVIKGYLQKLGIDYDETFAPTMSFGTILLVLHISPTLRWYKTGCDIGNGNAYLEALTNREFFMELPPDYKGSDKDGNPIRVVVRLLKNLYGSKQAANMWYNLITKVLIEFGFDRSRFEPCLFVKRDEEDVMVICIYVDDLLLTGSDERKIENVKKDLAKAFNKFKDLETVPKYLGLRMTTLDNGQIQLSQTEYIDDIISKFIKAGIPVVDKETPLPKDLESLVGIASGNETSILDTIGKIRILADRTRPDIAFTSSFLHVLVHNPLLNMLRHQSDP
jgi:hypothetical protein